VIILNIVILGGGKIGFYLIKTLIPFNHSITVVEKNRTMCDKISNEFNIPVINGDGTEVDILKEAINKTNIFIALTGNDEDNLISCQLAKKNFGVKKTLSKVNNPKNINIFEKLGVDYSINSTSKIAELIEQEVDFSGVKTLMKLKTGNVVISEILIESNSPIINKLIKDMNIPKDCILMSVIRDKEVIIPNGYTEIKNGDCVIVISSKTDQKELKEFFVGNFIT
jgi:trk system potassium uptake protein TrkA